MKKGWVVRYCEICGMKCHVHFGADGYVTKVTTSGEHEGERVCKHMIAKWMKKRRKIDRVDDTVDLTGFEY